MPRKFRSTDYLLRPDPKFDNKLLSKFINCIMQGGKKSTANRVMYDALDIVAKRIPDEPPLDVFMRAIENLKPQVEVRSKRVGGATYQVPMEVRPKRKQALALRWLLDVCRKKKGRPLSQRLAEELVAASRETNAGRPESYARHVIGLKHLYAGDRWTALVEIEKAVLLGKEHDLRVSAREHEFAPLKAKLDDSRKEVLWLQAERIRGGSRE